MTIKRSSIHNDYVLLDTRILQDRRLSLEGKGMYCSLEAGGLKIEDIPENIIKELIEVGYLEEVAE